ncbi:amylo-alpha-1,6-glucosidase [Lysobacter niastensis]|uniref:Amylo-alpha-1,6-glucosidase n=1 Tax=Lysobacter niastensis TaxID=380629 RepID=A0ABS0B3R1_9GAMM|nr:amylo-alpha-1,6-glucosidase [Lysobacter niastensis]MBF6023121.1 amylo-alpha-1,6-glucosidase [Lysobacter niastensis]
MDPAASASLNTSYVLKDGDSFLIANRLGDVEGGADGQFHNDTRILSRFRVLLGDSAPMLLSSYVTRDNVFFVAHLTNRQLPPLGNNASFGQGLVYLKRMRFLHGDRLYERLLLANYGTVPAFVPLVLEIEADFSDMFEVRGSKRSRRGDTMPVELFEHGQTFRYRGLDAELRSSSVAFSAAPHQASEHRVEFQVELAAGGREVFYVEVGAEMALPSRERFRSAAALARSRMRRRARSSARLRSSGPLFNAWMDRSRADLAMLTSELETGPYPYAGVPWFSTPFGRDAVITALQTLWLDPALARGVLKFLASHQAQEESAFMDSSPGKIMHETRKGEMSTLGELPFGRYYGGVDTTPLFVGLAGAFLQRTGDVAFIDSIWPALIAATGWIERVCDANRHGFLDYQRGQESGLANQGWKDSSDSVFHADGRPPQGAIALVEVQGYVFAALRAMASMASLRGDEAASLRWLERAERIRVEVERRYWMPDRGFYGIAIDAAGELCAVRSSNAGHLLYSGLPESSRAAQVTQQLLDAPFFNGWGIRTLAQGETHFNPMSYHNGSVWPHDSALCAAGIAAYGERQAATRLLRGAFESAVHFDMRLPELFCGFPRTPGSAPVAYPVACLPQAWAAGSAFMLVQACLGIAIDGRNGEVAIERPQLPVGIDEVVVRHVPIGEYRIHLVLKRLNDRVGVFVEGRDACRVPVRIRA